MPDPRDSLVNSLVGAGSAIDGDLDVEGMLRVDGDLRGSLRVTGKVVVGSLGRVEASIRARSAIIGGTVKGDVYVSEQLRLLAGGVIVGNVYAPRIEVEDNTVINGYIEVNGNPEAAEAGLKAFVERYGGRDAAIRFLGRFRSSSFAPPRQPEQAALAGAAGAAGGSGAARGGPSA